MSNDSEGDVVDAELVDDAPPRVSLVKDRVSLVKQTPGKDPLDDESDDEDDWWEEDDEPGGELELRPRHPLARLQYVTLAPVARSVATRARQATARHLVWVADQPVVARSLHVGRQVPRVTLHVVLHVPHGVARCAHATSDFLRDARSSDLLTKHSEAGEGESYAKVANARAQTDVAGRRWAVFAILTTACLAGLAWWAPARFAGVLAVTVFLGVAAMAPRRKLDEWLWGLAVAAGAGGAAWWFGQDLARLVPRPPGWAWWVILAGATGVFGWIGRERDRPLMTGPPVMVAHRVPALTAPMVMAALVVLGNSKMKFPEEIRLLMDPHRDGPGVRIELELPPGVTASYVMERREEFAAALRFELGTVWPSVGVRHPGHLVLYVSDQPMAQAEQEPWPLLHAGEVDIFKPVPAFTNQRGAWIWIVLAYASVIIGSVPRMGKTFTLRELLLIAGLDRRVKVVALDGKGTGDLSPIAVFAHAYVRGARSDRPENIEKVRAIVRWLLGELGRRADILDGLTEDECPESKVTSDLIDARPDLDLGPIVVGIDETQSFFSFGQKSNRDHREIRDEIREGFTELSKLGPAVGIWVHMASQQVRESTIPTDVAANAVIRYAMKLEGWEPNDRILGTSSYKNGIDATMFDFGDKGIGILKAEGMRAEIARSVLGLDAPASRVVAERCRRMRVADGTLTGDAADDGITDAEIVIDIVTDVEQVMRQRKVGKAQHGEMVEWLRELREENYLALDVDELSARLRAREIPISQVWSNGRNAKGVKLSDLRKPVRP